MCSAPRPARADLPEKLSFRFLLSVNDPLKQYSWRPSHHYAGEKAVSSNFSLKGMYETLLEDVSDDESSSMRGGLSSSVTFIPENRSASVRATCAFLLASWQYSVPAPSMLGISASATPTTSASGCLFLAHRAPANLTSSIIVPGVIS